MKVEILRLSGLDAAQADAEAEKLIDIINGPPDLRRLIIVDDTALLAEHETAYLKLDNTSRTDKMLCVSVGPRAAGSRVLRLPLNFGGSRNPVLWASNPAGINCRLGVAAVALGRPGKASGLDLLTEILLDQEVYDRVLTIFEEVPYHVANPGMWLVGQDDETATFTAALGLATRMLCSTGPGAEGPFRELLPQAAGGASLAEDGQLARYRDEVLAAADGAGKRTGFLGRFRPGQGDLHTRLIDAGAALADLRGEVGELLRKANTNGDLNDIQHRLIASAGIVFPTKPRTASSARGQGTAAERGPLYRTVVKALHGGDALPLVSRRLTLTERELKHNGSASYLSEVDKCCAQQLIDRLTDPAERPSRRDAARPEQDLARAADAARALEHLIVTVASREWSPAGPSRSEVGRIRAALDGAGREMTEHAAKTGTGSKARATRPARLAEMLLPVLRDLVIDVMGAEIARPSGTALEALETARKRTAKLIEQWVAKVKAGGISTETPFPSSGKSYASIFATPDDVIEIRDALLYQPVDEMWQLCDPDDLKTALNLTARPQVLGFAGKANKDALAPTLSGDQPAWTTSGSNAGLLRLVSLRPECVSASHVTAGSSETPDPESW